jgi:hypothetical protein
MITRYEIVVCDNYHKLIEKVNSEIQKGWQPFGGVSMVSSGKCAQVIVLQSGEME